MTPSTFKRLFVEINWPLSIFKDNLHAKYGQLDVALALRDQRVLNEAMQAPRRTRRVLRNSLTQRFPAVPLTSKFRWGHQKFLTIIEYVKLGLVGIHHRPSVIVFCYSWIYFLSQWHIPWDGFCIQIEALVGQKILKLHPSLWHWQILTIITNSFVRPFLIPTPHCKFLQILPFPASPHMHMWGTLFLPSQWIP